MNDEYHFSFISPHGLLLFFKQNYYRFLSNKVKLRTENDHHDHDEDKQKNSRKQNKTKQTNCFWPLI